MFCTRECYNGFNVHYRVGVRMKYLVPDRVYDVLKWVGLIAIPAVAALVGTVGTAVGWDATGVDGYAGDLIIPINEVKAYIGDL